MFSLSLWRGSRSDSSEHTASTSTSSSSHTTEESWIPSGRSKSTACENISLACSALPDTKRLVVQAAVTKLFDNKWFDICTLDKTLSLVGARQSGAAYDMLHALHCVHYDKMPPELRSRIPELVNECLRQNDNIVDATEVALRGVAF